MRQEEKYREVFSHLNDIIAKRNTDGALCALGYTSNLDVLCDFQVEVLNELLEKYVSDADLYEMKAVKKITGIEEFLETIVFFCSKGIGGEVDITDFNILQDTFAITNGIGGTAVQGAMALAAVKCPSMVHLTDNSKEVCDYLNSPYILAVSKEGELVQTNDMEQTSEQEIHYIMQFKKGDVIRLNHKEIVIPLSNRLIITKITVNKTVPFSEAYFAYVEKHAVQIKSNVLSSFNSIEEESVLEERLDYVKRHISVYKQNNPNGIVYFEDAHYHQSSIRNICLASIYPHVDIVSLNEEELLYTLQMDHFNLDSEDVVSYVRGAEYILKKFQIKEGIIIHTKDFSMYVGNPLKVDIEMGLVIGNVLATAKALYGWYGSEKEIEEVLNLPLGSKGIAAMQRLEANNKTDRVILVPTKYIDKPKYTIGLGDSFTAGVQICFA